jgi:hypothetical protein
MAGQQVPWTHLQTTCLKVIGSETTCLAALWEVITSVMKNVAYPYGRTPFSLEKKRSSNTLQQGGALKV